MHLHTFGFQSSPVGFETVSLSPLSSSMKHYWALQPMPYICRSFGGFASKDKWLEEAVKLSKDLGSSVSYIKDYYYTAGYNSPFQLFNRHNEIWFIAQ